jgi:hypothetical protein
LTRTLEDSLSRLRPREHYLSKLNALEANIDSLDSFHLVNVMRLHIDEHDVLKSNLEYLTKAAKENIRSLYSL